MTPVKPINTEGTLITEYLLNDPKVIRKNDNTNKINPIIQSI